MPITRRRRANPPEQPEQANSVNETTEQKSTAAVDATAVEGAAEAPKEAEAPRSTRARAAKSAHSAESSNAAAQVSLPSGNATSAHDVAAPSAPTQRGERVEAPTPPTTSPAAGNSYQPPAAPPITPAFSGEPRAERFERGENVEHHGHPVRPERIARMERQDRQNERQDYAPSIEGGRRTARGELFRRPPQPPTQHAVQPAAPVAPLQAPSHEISLPLGNLLHLAYNPGYTGSEEARSELLQQLVSESKAGGRARCWSCGSLAIVYDRWQTGSKTFGEVGVAFCEICGVWSVM